MKIRKELWFGFTLMAIIIAGTALMLLLAPTITNGHLGLMMLALVLAVRLQPLCCAPASNARRTPRCNRASRCPLSLPLSRRRNIT